MLSTKERKEERFLSKGLPKRLYLTYRCNDNCIFCYDGVKHKTLPDLPLEEAKGLVVKFKNEGQTLISLGGSEPTLYPHLFELIEFIKSLGLKFRMASNLRRCSDKNFAKKVAESGLVSVYTSLHGHNAELHDKIARINGSFQSRTEGMRNLTALGVKIETNTTITTLNFKYLRTIAEFIWRNFEPFRMRFAFLWCTANVLDDPKGIMPKIPEIRPYLKEAMDYLKEKGPYAFIEKAPICLLPEYWKDFKSEYYMLTENVKPSICRSCKFYSDNNCVGISPVYLSLYGDSDLIPQKRKKWLFF
ncbi:MAG: radical SAM protein [bacterium]|nr:radical SAM protein [bacterium]